MVSTEQGSREIEQLAQRFRRLHRHILEYRRPHFFNEPQMDPRLEEPIDHVKFQHDELRQTWTELKSRLTENHYVIRASSRRNKKASDNLTEYLNSAALLVEQRLGYSLQEPIVDGQAIDCYAVLHWRRMDDMWPDMPEEEWLEDEPTGRYAKNYEKQDDGRYKEKAESVLARAKEARAKAGFPYYVDVLDPTTVFFREDMTGSLGSVAHIREVGYIDYAAELGESGTPLELFKDNVNKLRVREKQVPSDDTPSGTEFDKITVATLWTKTEWLEYVSEDFISTESKTEADFTKWEFVKRGKHNFGRPPFEIIMADRFNAPDPLYRYLPALEGVFRLKPNADRMTAIVSGLAERHAVPDVWWQQQPNALPGLDVSGQQAVLGTDAASAGTMPAGYELKMATIQINAAMIEMAQRHVELMGQARPNTGTAELSATTQPWTARLAMQQANVYPKQLLKKIALGIQNCWRSILRDMSTIEGGVWAYKLDDEGFETDELIGVEQEDIPTMNLIVEIEAISTPEQITLVEHGANLKERRLITPEDYFTNYAIKPNPTRYIMELEAQEVVDRFLKPGLMAQAVAQIYGPQVVVGPDGNLIGMGGQPVDPNQFVADNGWQRAPQNGLGQNTQGAGLPPLVDNPPEGVMQQPSMPGMGPV